MIALDSPFLSEPLTDTPNASESVQLTKPAQAIEVTASRDLSSSQPSPYVSANTSLRATPEPDNGQVFETLWETFSPELNRHSVRGWYEKLVEEAVRQLQKKPNVQMDVISGEQTPFLGELLFEGIDTWLTVCTSRRTQNPSSSAR